LLDSNQKSDKNSAGEGRMDAGGGVIVVVGSEIWKAEACNNAALFFSSSFLLNPSLTAVRFFSLCFLVGALGEAAGGRYIKYRVMRFLPSLWFYSRIGFGSVFFFFSGFNSTGFVSRHHHRLAAAAGVVSWWMRKV
jgi:hypothetical protein